MKGVRLLTVATVTSDHRPIAGPAMASSIEVLSTLAHRLNPSGSSTFRLVPGLVLHTNRGRNSP